MSVSKGTSISGTPRYQYSNIVGIGLSKHGAPIGSKVLHEIKVPEWIASGDADIKSAFLGALFDDEGYFRDTPTSRQIVFKAAKSLSLKKNLEEYLRQIISMLDSFDIKTSSIRSDQIKKTKNGTEMISLRFWITKNENFQVFRKHLQLLHPERIEKLNNILCGSR
ncbi:MAG: LAGLIDADG family homing endonuclease [Candidatus Aenigmarchaeota archaeon]|nr:LAGLIDADG family homing endonuclease [Candidatus Aenigmarchaeota archaeon]